MFDMQLMSLALSLALFKAGSNIAARTAMIAITMRSSIKVKIPLSLPDFQHDSSEFPQKHLVNALSYSSSESQLYYPFCNFPVSLYIFVQFQRRRLRPRPPPLKQHIQNKLTSHRSRTFRLSYSNVQEYLLPSLASHVHQP